MTQTGNDRSIRIKGSAHGNTIVSGDHNFIQIFQRSVEHPVEALADKKDIVEIGANPYKGLAAFKETDADRYFGRETQIKKLWERFRDLYEPSGAPRVLPILGPSGCGKSSLVRAGLLPELVQRPLPVKSSMRVAAMTPGAYPLESLASVLAEVNPTDPLLPGFEEELKQINLESNEYEGLRRIANRIRDIRDTPLIILIDQFEEVYSLCKQPEQQRAFIQNLLHAASDPTGNVSVIFTLRTDFVGETQRYDQLNQIICSEGVLIPGMTKDELRRAIAEPARQAGYIFDDATVDLLISDTEGREGALPLLQFALTRIWEGLQSGQAAIVTYRDIGRVGGALAGEAQKIYDELTEPEKKTARRIFTGLVQPGDGTRDTRRCAIIENLVAGQDTLEVVRHIIQRFSSPGTRLISLSSKDGKETAEIVHEALIDSWQELENWIDSNRDDIRFQRRLEAAATRWNNQGRPSGLLWRSLDLELLQKYQQRAIQDMTLLQIAFLEASGKAKFWKRVQLNVGIATVISLASLIGFLIQQGQVRKMQAYALTANTLRVDDPIERLINGTAAVGLSRSWLLKLPNIFQPNLISEAILDPLNRSQPLKFAMPHANIVSTVAFSPNGEVLASGADDGTIRIWNAKDGSLLHILEDHSDGIMSISISPDSQKIVSGSRDGAIRLWDIQGSEIVDISNSHGGSEVTSVAFSPDGQFIASVGKDGSIKLWTLSGSNISRNKHADQSWVNDVAFSPNGQMIISGGDDGNIRFWDINLNLIGIIDQAHDGWIDTISFSPDGQIVASGGNDGKLRLWNLQGQPVGEPIEVGTDQINDVSFSPDGQNLVTATRDGKLRIWDLRGNLTHQPINSHYGWVDVVVFSPDGSFLVSGGTTFRSGDSELGSIRVWSLEDDSMMPPIEADISGVNSIGLSPNGEWIVTGGGNGTVRLFNLENGSMVNLLPGDSGGWISSVVFSPDGKWIASGSENGVIRLWSLDEDSGDIGNPISQESHSKQAINALSFSPNSQIIVTGGADNKIELRDLDLNLVQVFESHDDEVTSVVFNPKGHIIASGSYDKEIIVWDLNGAVIRRINSETEVDTLAFHPDGKIIASGGADRAIKLWNLEGDELPRSPFRGHSRRISSVAFSPDGETVVSGSADGSVRSWNLSGELLAHPLQGHSEPINSIALSSDGKMIFSAGLDGTVRLWPTSFKEGWVSYTCEILSPYLSTYELTEDEDVVEDARSVCKNVWE